MAFDNRDLNEEITKEMKRWPSVGYSVENGGRHNRLVLKLGRKSRFVTLPKTASDWRAGKNLVTQLRRELKTLGVSAAPVVPAAKFGAGDKLLSLTIPEASPLFSHFADKHRKGVTRWRYELRSNPELGAPPFLAVVRAPLAPGQVRGKAGVQGGFWHPTGKGWTIAMQASLYPQIRALGAFTLAEVEFLGEQGDALLFRVPAWAKEPAPELPAPAAPAPDMDPPPAALNGYRPPADEYGDELNGGGHIGGAPRPLPEAPSPAPIYMQVPRERISLERAINTVNAYKEKMGHNLKLVVLEGGYLAATAKLGRQ